MKARNILAALLLMAAGLQQIWAQKVVLYKTNGQTIECETSELDSIVLVEHQYVYVTSIALSETSISLQPGASKTLTVTVLPENAENKEVTWQSSNTAVAVVTNAGMVVARADGTTTITCSATDGSGVYAECQVTVTSGTTPDPGNHAWVDLGLPSGTLWATCNVGANSPEEYGDYFAWGETEPKDTYNWDTYFDSDSNKYNKNGGLTELLPADDAATVNWGSGWQMPSMDQIYELISIRYTTTEWTTQNGVSGRKITSKSNGNSLFLPAAGYRDSTSLYGAGSDGGYWSRSLSTDNGGNAFYLYFNSSSFYTDNSGRYYGLSVRPVRVQE